MTTRKVHQASFPTQSPPPIYPIFPLNIHGRFSQNSSLMISTCSISTLALLLFFRSLSLCVLLWWTGRPSSPTYVPAAQPPCSVSLDVSFFEGSGEDLDWVVVGKVVLLLVRLLLLALGTLVLEMLAVVGVEEGGRGNVGTPFERGLSFSGAVGWISVLGEVSLGEEDARASRSGDEKGW